MSSLTLEQVGIRLLPDEIPEVGVSLEGGLTEELEKRGTALLLTNRRLVRYSVGGDRVSVVSASIEDVQSLEVVRTGKNRQWVWVGVVFIGGGLLLGLLSLFFLSSPVSLWLMAFSLVLIGVVFVLTYVGGTTGRVVIRAGTKLIACKMKPAALDEMAILVRRFHELKLGSGREPGTPRGVTGLGATSGARTTGSSNHS